MGSVGINLPGVLTKLDNPDSTGEGEVCMAGRHIFMGYLNEPQKTKETKDEDGWLHSGDLGRFDDRGFLYITGKLPKYINKLFPLSQNNNFTIAVHTNFAYRFILIFNRRTNKGTRDNSRR